MMFYSLFQKREISEGVDLMFQPDCDESIVIIHKGIFYYMNSEDKNKALKESDVFITARYFLSTKITLRCQERGSVWTMSLENFKSISATIFRTMSEKFVNFSKKCTLLQQLSNEELEKFSKEVILITFKAKEYIFIDFPKAEILYIIYEGTVAYRTDYLVADVYLNQGDFFGFNEFLNGRDRVGEAKVLSESFCFCCKKETFLKYFSKHADFFELYKLKTIIRSTPQYHKIYSNSRDELLNRLEPGEYQKDEMVFQSGKEANIFLIVRSGELLVYCC